MVESKIINFLKSSNFNLQTKYLLGVSGGVDSMVLLGIMAKHFKVSVAHINHGMRGEESDQDAALVEKTCKQLGIPCYITVLPDEYKRIGNFQSVARAFRYNFFKELLLDKGYDVIITAHHRDDTIETTLLNMLRGTGLEGLQGIPSSNVSMSVIRPMISIPKSAIVEYANENKVKFREDSSNSKDAYKRNYLRHHLLPVIDKEFGMAGIYRTITQTQQYYEQYLSLLNQILSPIINDQNIIIDSIKLASIHNPALALFYYAKEYTFNIDHCKNLLENQSGKSIKIRSEQYEMVKDRTTIIIRKIEFHDTFFQEVNEPGTIELGKHKIKIHQLQGITSPTHDKNSIVLSFDESPFPIIIRSRKDGDYFMPSGMKGQSKKVKKFIMDSKLSTREKEQLFIIEKETIVAIFPYRAAEGYSYDKSKLYHIQISFL